VAAVHRKPPFGRVVVDEKTEAGDAGVYQGMSGRPIMNFAPSRVIS